MIEQKSVCTCDKCGAQRITTNIDAETLGELIEDKSWVGWLELTRHTGDPDDDPSIDLCPKCARKFDRWMGGKDEAPAFVVVPAPGDRCGNTKKLADGSKCPGCRACC